MATDTLALTTPSELMAAVREIGLKLERLAGRLEYDDIYLFEVLEELLDAERRITALASAG